ncbi:MAG: ATP synthase F1 subunit delta [Elusimicrobia bacterium RIFCSPHIGHO2_01_FULL_64_10]|nr:MAG: ATP synthase F1 subunit delta [Elusimicrobia bacterium RIFCSPHIGHO2_01_FULL_64_10]
MKETLAAHRYAKALFLAARDRRGVSLDAVKKKMGGLCRALAADHAVREAAGSPLIPFEKKCSALCGVLGDRTDPASELLGRFVRLLLSKKRASLLPLIAARFESVVEESRQALKAVVGSAAPLTEGDLRSLEAGLSRLTGKKVSAEVSVRPELIGGLVVRAGDLVIDNTLKSRLKDMKTLLGS